MSETRLVEVRYLGRVKNRPDGSQTAFGLSGGRWSVAITKAALYGYFGVSDKPGEAITLYSVLGISGAATDDEIKQAWRRMIKQWHPDRCKEPDARKQFDAIQHAYTVLSTKRAKYDAGLALQASLTKTYQAAEYLNPEFGYRSPLRCGWILGEGITKSGKFTIEKVLQWTDIVNEHGQTLVVSWIMGEDRHREEWA